MKKTMTILMVAMLLVVGMFVLTSCSKPAAVVNGEKITYKELDKELESMYGKMVIEELIVKKLIDQDARKYKINVSKEDIDKEIDKLKATPNFERIVQMQGMESVKEYVKFKMLISKLATKDATDEQMKKFYSDNKDRLNQVKASHILVLKEDEAKKTLARLNSGEDFAKVAKEVSIDPGSKDKGGELGYFNRVAMDPEFAKAAFATPVGQLSGIVKTNFGYHIIKVEDKKDTYDLLKEDVRQAYVDESKLRSYMENLKKNAKITNYLDKKEDKKEDKKSKN